MKIQKFVAVAFCIAAGVRAAAETYMVGDDPGRYVLTDGETLVPSTIPLGDGVLPDGIPEPSFWLDASDRTGWEFADDDRTQVTKVPSKTGERYLTTSTAGGDWMGWTLKSPVVATDLGKLRGGAYLDFGGYGSNRGFVFNPVDGHTALTNVATVVTVFGSQAGGGHLLGGGYTPGGGYAFSRNGRGSHDTNDNVGYDGSVFDTSARDFYRGGVLRQNGNITDPVNFGMAGDWEIISLAATSDKGEATGIGINDARTQHRNGGMRIAEMLIFKEILTQAQCAKLEAYLERKWMGNPTAGLGGDAHVAMVRSAHTGDGGSDPRLSDHPTATVLNVAAPVGEKLTIDKLYGGGYGGSRLVKTGAGALAFGSAEAYGGTVTLKGGTLDLTKKAIPTAMPSNWVFQLDASAPNAVTVESHHGTNDWVTFWKNECDVSFKGTYPEGAFNYRNRSDFGAECQPRFRANALGEGRHVVDFGAWLNNWTASDYLPGRSGNLRIGKAGATAGTYAVFAVPRISTVVAVMSAHGGGGTVVTDANGSSSRFGRASASRQINTPLTPNTPTVSGCVVTNRVFLDNARLDGTKTGARTYGWQVMVQQCAQESIQNIGCLNNDWYSGGFQLAELVLYDRILSDAEIKDVTAYLTKKWFGRAASGYEPVPGEADVPALQSVAVEAPSTIHVARGTVRLAKLAVNAPLVKTGAGRLEVVSVADDSQIEVKEGSFAVVAPHDPGTNSELAPGCALHLDATVRNSMYVCIKNGCKNVNVWHDVSGRNGATAGQSDSSYLQTDKGGVLDEGDPDLGGKSVVRFPQGRGMRLMQSLDNVRHAYAIVGSQEGGGNVFGGARKVMDGDNAAHNDFSRGGSDRKGATASDPILCSANNVVGQSNAPLRPSNGGRVVLDGVEVDADKTGYNGGYQLVEFHAAVGMHISSLGCAAIGWQDNYMGRTRLAEVVVYERELTAREQVATRNYLRQKWFGTTPEALPGEPPVPQPYADADVAVTGGATNTFDVAAGDVTVRREIWGAGTLVKTGAGTLTVKDMSRFAGTVAVAGGTLQVTGAAAAVEPALPLDGRLAHFDASADGAAEIEATSGILKPTLTLPNLVEGSAVNAKANGSTVQMTYGTRNGRGFIRLPAGQVYYNFLDAAGAFTGLTNICSALWVLGSENGGGCLLGGYINEEAGYPSTPYSYAWQRQFDDSTQPLMNASALAAYKTGCNWHLNGEAVNPTTATFSGDFDQVSMVVKEDQSFAAVAGGLAMCGYGSLVYSSGAQDIAEIILYDRKLTDDEREGAEAYLNAKWGLKNQQWGRTNDVELVLGADGAFDCGTETQFVAAVSGGGAVGNGALEARKIVLDLENPETLTAETFVFADGFCVEVRNAIGAMALGDYRLLTATEGLVGSFDKTAVVFTGVENPPASKIFRRGNDLYVRIGQQGLTLIVR